MKNLYTLIGGLLLIVVIGILLHSCKKSGTDGSSDSGCVVGGFDATTTYVFYQSKDYGGGYFTVSVKDANGNNVSMDRSQTSVYDTAPPTNACGDAYTSKRADVFLLKGKTFTYTAHDNSRSYSGTINVPCSPVSNCNVIKIDQ